MWDVFAEEAIKLPMRGFKFNVDTGDSAPVCCKTPRYGLHEAKIILELVEQLEKNGLIHDDLDSPYGALVVLASKPHQGHKHWSEFVWRFCVSYKALNRVTRPFAYPTRRCDDAARDIGDSKYFITMDLMSGYWQIVLTEAAQSKLAFFVPNGKKTWGVMPMGATNAHPAYCAIMEILKKKWDAKAVSEGLCLTGINVSAKRTSNMSSTIEAKVGSENVVDDICLHGNHIPKLLAYFRIVLTFFMHYRVTVSLKKCRLLPSSAEFVGYDMEADGNRPAKSKDHLFENLRISKPESMGDLRILIGLLGFYQEWIPLFEVRIKQWRDYQKDLPPGKQSKEDEKNYFELHWNESDEKLRTELLNEIKQRPTLARPNFSRRFYLKTDWSAQGKAAVLLQACPESDEARKLEEEEIAGALCKLETTVSAGELRLRPISFISARNTKAEESYHSFIGEAFTGLWAMNKYRRYLFGAEFTWLTDCSGGLKFFEAEEMPNHATQRWRMQMLMYDFTMAHRPDRMMKEVDALNRYNMWTAEWRTPGDDKEDGLSILKPKPFTSLIAREIINKSHGRTPCTNVRIAETGPEAAPKTELAIAADTTRKIWVLHAATCPVSESCHEAGIKAVVSAYIEDRHILGANPHELTTTNYFCSSKELAKRLETAQETVDWIVAATGGATEQHWWTEERTTQFQNLVLTAAKHHQLQALILIERMEEDKLAMKSDPREWIATDMEWSKLNITMQATEFGGTIESLHRVCIAVRNNETLEHINLQNQAAQPLLRKLDDPNNVADDVMQIHELATMERPRPSTQQQPDASVIAARVQLPPDEDTNRQGTEWTNVYDINQPGPSLLTAGNLWFGAAFAIEVPNDLTNGTGIRGLRPQELMRVYGFSKEQQSRFLALSNGEMLHFISGACPSSLLTTVMEALHKAERKSPRLKVTDQTKQQTTPDQQTDSEETQKLRLILRTMTAFEINNVTSLPMPTKATWQEATQQDADLSKILTTMLHNNNIERAELKDKRYHDEWKANRLEVEDGLLYRYEASKRASLRQVRTRIVPTSLRLTVFAALHPSPMAGHSGFEKTYWRIATRFWWPNMASDIRTNVLSCAMCRAANITSHEAQQIMKTLHSDAPFDVIALDVWSPGHQVTNKKMRGGLLTGLCVMTGFAGVGPLQSEKAEDGATCAYQHFFIARGLPLLVVIDDGSTFKGFLLRLLGILGIAHYCVTKENHRAIICERFHRYLNKVEKIHAAECQSYEEWLMGALFAVYAWNASPVDGTDICRSMAAIGRDFPFPIDVENNAIVPRQHTFQGDQVLEHLSVAFPLLQKQRTLLNILTQERRERHRELKDAAKTTKAFAIGDLVLVRKQVQTKDKAPAKLRIRARGPYRILEKIHEGTYMIQKLPFVSDAGKAGKAYKESAARMELLPSTLQLHKTVAGIDTRMATFDREAVPHPLENTLGIIDFGAYSKALPDKPFAYDRIADLWPDIELDESDSSSEEPEPTSEANQSPIAKRTRARTEAPNNNKKRSKWGPAIITAESTLQGNINASHDKMFFIRFKMPSNTRYQWYVVQARPENSDPDETKKSGKYLVRWFIRHPDDSKNKTLKECRYWPEVHSLRKDGSMGPIVPVRPAKIDGFLETRQHAFAAYEDKVDLLRDGIVGPFDLQKHIQNKTNEHTIAAEQWDLLESRGHQFGVDTSNIGDVSPLQTSRK